ncbi:MAG: 1,4-dihydroxy-2-naphthoate octaprenyltransferase [Deltaproteobacteria bacterium]|nr:1,4-dihydroxy-2-naphthoate octaprenyltransferase [Deltaproteobacteria bacterium]MBW2130387.1 1,4-dihydroxy-2-naphthoate octaprenyltransferase [Deltaproteobacteria bacterium]
MVESVQKMPPLWIVKTRAPFFTASILPIILGTSIAWARTGTFHPGYFLLVMIAAVCIHAGVNMTNDYFDHTWGSDEVNQEFASPFTGGSRLIQMGIVSPRTMLWQGMGFFLAGTLIGLYLAYARGLGVLWLGVFGVLTGYFYTAPPFRLAATGAGEIFVALDFGVLMVLGAYYVQTLHFSKEAVIASLPVAVLIAAVLYINEFQDMKADRTVGKRQIVVRLGRRKAASGYGLLMVAAYGSLVLGVLLGGVSPFALLGLLSGPLAWKAYRIVRSNYDNLPALVPANAKTIKAHILMGALLSVGYILQLMVGE